MIPLLGNECAKVFDICGKEPLIEVAVELEKQALADPYFVERKLYPNVDFYSGLIYKAMGNKLPLRHLARIKISIYLKNRFPYRHVPSSVHHTKGRRMACPLA